MKLEAYNFWLPLLILPTLHPLPQATTSLFSYLSWVPFFFFCLILFCQIPHISEIIQFLSFSFWFISLSVMLSNSTHVVINGRISSFFMSKWYLCVCLCETYLTNIYKCNMYLARFLHPFFSHWWTQIFFSPCLTYHKQCGNEHTGANIFAI